MEFPTKRAAMEALLESGSAYVYLDPRHPDVDVPARFRQHPQLVLQFGMHLAIPIYDLFVDDSGVGGTLSFNRSPHFCTIPWDAVYALVGDDGRGSVFLESVPREIRREIDGGPAEFLFGGEPPSQTPTTRRDTLPDPTDPSELSLDDPSRDNVIPLWPRGVRSERPSQPPRRPTDGGPKPRPPHLRRVK